MKNLFVFCLCACLASIGGLPAYAQYIQRTQPDTSAETPLDTLSDAPPRDGYYDKTDFENRKVVPYSHIRGADVRFAKRIWREIDLRDSANTILSSPNARLIDILMDAIMAGELTAYDPTPTKEDPNGDSFKVRLAPGGVMSRVADSVLVPQFDNEGNEIGAVMMAGEFNPDSVQRFRIKEDWIFDKQRSIFEPRIVGIAPLMTVQMGGVTLDDQPAFWVYFPEARHILVNKEVADAENDATGLSFDDIFTRRLFTSTIVKESNPRDLRIKDYAEPGDYQKESDAVEGKLDEYEKGLWIKKPEEKKKKKFLFF